MQSPLDFNAIETRDPQACQYCEEVVEGWDKRFPGDLPPGVDWAAFYAQIYQTICSLPGSELPPSAAAFCKALAGKEQAFGEAYVKHHDQKERDPCKEVQIC
ncbi:hypothetical protein DdX_15331 [Ditylenchus destructor]|uniref:Uncharacterized protein n=1 Tax=Ditylenchus destructor TaxID=166010 RepID=A0AAD4MPL0_9BILA|nr:hypothetical protein DdX_15331 [Ditylenchus destructor]